MTGLVDTQLSQEELFDRWHELAELGNLPVPNWAGARCAELIELGQLPADAWFPDKPDRETQELAKAVCKQCPIIEKCGVYGVQYETDGIWGGVDLNPPKEYTDRTVARQLNREGKCSHGHDLDLTCPDVHGNVKRMCSRCLANRQRKIADPVSQERMRDLIAGGTSNADIAQLMGVHKRTVERYRKRMIESDEREVA